MHSSHGFRSMIYSTKLGGKSRYKPSILKASLTFNLQYLKDINFLSGIMRNDKRKHL